MSTIFRFTESSSARLDEAMRVITLLLQGLALHAVEGEPEEYERFRECVLKEIESFEADPANRLLMTTGAVLKQLEEYNRHTSRVLKAQALERQAMIAMLSQTIVKLGAVGERTAARLQEIESKLERASELDDVRSLRARLAECLENIRESRQQHWADSQAVVENARSQMPGQGAGPALEIPDAVTGLPDMRAALRELAAPSPDGLSLYVAAFAANRLRAINARFGYAVGDMILNAVKEQIEQRVSAGDRLFRWRGPCIVALMPRPDSLLNVRREVARIGSFRQERTIEIGNRMILLPITCVSTVIPAEGLPAETAAQVDAFVAQAEPPEPPE
jgi:GGDEF domain-containing protein